MYNKVIEQVLQLCLLICCCRATTLHVSNRLNLSSRCPNAHCIVTDLSDSSLTAISAPQLQELIIRQSSLRNVPAKLLTLVPQLHTLILHSCGINSISGIDFEGGSTLERLMLQRNRLSRLPERAFSLLPKLKVLELGFNYIHSVHAQAFADLGQLELLGLQENSIYQLAEGSFASLVNLTHLDLSGNELESLDAALFAQSTQLQTLLLNGNDFADFDGIALAGLPNLRLLDLSNCSALQKLEVHNVDMLVMEGSGAQQLVIGGSVIRLLAGHSELMSVSIADKRSVIELDLHTNLLSDVAELLEGMVNLHRLDLSKNNIETLLVKNSSAALMLPSLTHLNLASNHLHILQPETLLLLGRLEHLDISYNLLRFDVKSFTGLAKLERLYLEGNHLQELDYVELQLQHPNLKELGLGNNDWDYKYMRSFVTYLEDHGVRLPVRSMPQQQVIEDTVHAGIQLAQKQAGLANIHQYWTTRDILAFVTLIVVFLILLMQLYRILDDEGCVRRCQSRLRRWRRHRNNDSQPSVARPSRLREEESETSTSE